MLELNKGVDILANVGGVKTIDQANAIIDKNLDAENKQKLSKIKTEGAIIKIANAIAMCKPKDVRIHTGSEADKQWVRDYCLERGDEKKLAMKGHTIHFDLPQEQGRLVKQTFYIVNEGEKLSPIAKSVPRDEALDYVKKYVDGIMAGTTMLIGFYSRGPAGARASTPAIEITSSGYVVHSADILYRHCYEDFDKEAARREIFYTNVHSEGKNRPEDVPNARVYMDRSWFTTFSTFCTYAGNTLLMKKGNHRFSVDYATYYKTGEELSEHMFITGMKGPGGRITYIAGAAPSGCGKTTTAMAGTDFVGDDLAQFWIENDGTARAINPENGVFGIVEDVNMEGDPALMKRLRQEGSEVIWSNVLIDDKLVPHWSGNGESHPNKGTNFQGEWTEGKKNADGKLIPMSHPNSRCTILADQIETHNAKANQDPAGVPIKIVTYSGRDADTMPPVWAAKNADSGVAIGASIVSQATATEVGASGVKRQPWANAPFIPGALSDYMTAQFKYFNSNKYSKEGKPILAGLNYFLTHKSRGSNGEGLLGEKRDVPVWLGWLELYAHGEVPAIETPIGFIPKFDDLKKMFKEKLNKEYTQELYTMQFSLYVENILGRIDLQTKAYKDEGNIPQTLFDVYDEQAKGLNALKSKNGSIVKPQDL